MKTLVITAATRGEIAPLENYLRKNFSEFSTSSFQLQNLSVHILISGIGIVETAYKLMHRLNNLKPDAWIQIGIGGAVDKSLEIGNVYAIESEMLYGFGAQDKDGRILDPFHLGWMDQNEFPFKNGKLFCPYAAYITNLEKASGMTTLFAHGHAEEIEKIAGHSHGQIENMEGMPYFYVSLMESIPFLSLRAISNIVESRDKSKWQIEKAIDALNTKMITLLNEDLSLLFNS